MLSLALALLACAAPGAQEDPYRIPFEDEAAASGGMDQAALDAKMAAILPRLARLRGWSFHSPVQAGVQTMEEFRRFADAAFAEEYGAERFRGMTATAQLLGMLPEDEDLERMMKEMIEAAVGGYYDPKSSKFWIMEGFSQGPIVDVIMAHELQHALDDQHYPLDPLYLAVRGNSDREFAVRCVVEGSATSAMNLYLLQAMAEGWLPPGELMSADMIGEQVQAMNSVPASMVAGLILPYVEGNVFLLRGGSILATAMKEPADADLRRAFEAPPESSEQILHPEKYWDPERHDPPRAVEAIDRSAELGAGWTAVDCDVLGELGCAFLVAPRWPSPMELQFGAQGLRLPASMGWGGDQVRTYRHADGARLAHLVTLWDSEADAGEFAAALEAEAVRARAPALRRVRRAGDRVEVFFADAAALPALAVLAAAP